MSKLAEKMKLFENIAKTPYGKFWLFGSNIFEKEDFLTNFYVKKNAKEKTKKTSSKKKSESFPYVKV